MKTMQNLVSYLSLQPAVLNVAPVSAQPIFVSHVRITNLPLPEIASRAVLPTLSPPPARVRLAIQTVRPALALRSPNVHLVRLHDLSSRVGDASRLVARTSFLTRLVERARPAIAAVRAVLAQVHSHVWHAPMRTTFFSVDRVYPHNAPTLHPLSLHLGRVSPPLSPFQKPWSVVQ